MTYYAHSGGSQGEWETTANHLREVSRLAGDFAAAFAAEEEGAFAGLLHDFGKYGDRFQRRLKGLESGVDHWTAGAWERFDQGKWSRQAFCVNGLRVF